MDLMYVRGPGDQKLSRRLSWASLSPIEQEASLLRAASRQLVVPAGKRDGGCSPRAVRTFAPPMQPAPSPQLCRKEMKAY